MTIATQLTCSGCGRDYFLKRVRPERLGRCPRCRKGTVDERFWRRVTKTDSCWLWAGSLTPGGYGYIMDDGKRMPVHRWAHLRFIGPIPDRYDIDHLCRTRACVNPAHLEAVTRRENNRRGDGPTLVRNLRRRVEQLERENRELRERLGEYVLT